MRFLTYATSLCITLAPLPALAREPATPPPAEEAASYQEIQRNTLIDLSRLWTKYCKQREDGETFRDYASTHIRHRRNAGATVLAGGVAALAAGTTVLIIALQPTSGAEGDDGLGTMFGPLGMSIGAALMTIGGIQLYRNQSRLKRLRAAGYAQTPRLRLRAAAPLALPRGAGVGLAVAF